MELLAAAESEVEGEELQGLVEEVEPLGFVVEAAAAAVDGVVVVHAPVLVALVAVAAAVAPPAVVEQAAEAVVVAALAAAVDAVGPAVALEAVEEERQTWELQQLLLPRLLGLTGPWPAWV